MKNPVSALIEFCVNFRSAHKTPAALGGLAARLLLGAILFREGVQQTGAQPYLYAPWLDCWRLYPDAAAGLAETFAWYKLAAGSFIFAGCFTRLWSFSALAVFAAAAAAGAALPFAAGNCFSFGDAAVLAAVCAFKALLSAVVLIGGRDKFSVDCWAQKTD